MKKKEHEEKGLPFDGEFYLWDYRYYDRKFIETSLDLDDMLVKEYFPVTVVVPAILEIYQKLLGVKFEERKGETWHPGTLALCIYLPVIGITSSLLSEVQQFAVWEQDAKDETDFLGYCYLDLFPRGMFPVPMSPLGCAVPTLPPASKYSHAAVWPLLAGHDLSAGKRGYPIAAMVANLAKPTPNKPALMRHDDVVTFFHEMGHVFHGLLSRTKFARFHGTRYVTVLNGSGLF